MRKWLIGGISGVILLGTVGLYLINGKSKEGAKNLVKTDTHPAEPTVQQEELATWKDQSEISFQYPASLQINPHDEDTVNYAHLELTSDAHPGHVVVWVKDTNELSAEQWVKKTKAQTSLDSTLGGEPAKKIMIPGEVPLIQTTALKDGYLYQVEAKLMDEKYWNNVFGTVVSTFQIGDKQPLQQESVGESGNTGSADDIESEEVIE